VIDELPVPDRLEQSVGESEGEDVLCRFLAQEVVDPEDLFFVESLVYRLVELPCAGQIDAERLLHDDPGVRRQVCLVQRVHHGHHRLRRHAQVVQQASLAAECLDLLGHRARQGLRALLLGNKGQVGDELLEELFGIGVVGEFLAGLVRHFFAERLAVQLVE
jgi:hypothetical protein